MEVQRFMHRQLARREEWTAQGGEHEPPVQRTIESTVQSTSVLIPSQKAHSGTSLSDHLLNQTSVSQNAISETSRARPPKPDINQ